MQQGLVKKSIGIIIILGIVFLLLELKLSKNKPAVVESVPIVQEEVPSKKVETIGTSVQGRSIRMHSFGKGNTHLMFIGGIHGGYEWNSVLLAYTFIDYLEKHPELVPKNITIDIIPSANPDGAYAVTGKEGFFTTEDVSRDVKVLEAARFNANTVDINRNFDCMWQPTSQWRSKSVKAGTAAFSEPEAKAIKDVVLKHRPVSVIFWHSQSNAVYASQCESGILEETLNIMNIYAKAASYPAVKTFDAYKVTGAAEDWLASVGIPAITVELETHTDIQWDKNFAGFKAILQHYSKQ